MFKRCLLLVVALMACGSVSASQLNQHEEECYAVAMVGYDSVINSDLGVPLDEVISTMVDHSTSHEINAIYKDFLMLVVMEAYNWNGSPHTYAVKTLYNCASKHDSIAHS